MLSREQLLELSRLHNDEVYDRSVDVQVGRLRKKIEPKDGQAPADPHRAWRRIRLHGGGRNRPLEFRAGTNRSRIEVRDACDACAGDGDDCDHPSALRRAAT